MTTRDDDPELIDPRPDEHLPLARLEPYLRERLPAAAGPMTVRQFGGGHANLTYLVRFAEHEYVLRRPPLGPVAPSAHDMHREHRVLSRLYSAFALAPRSYLYCDDDTVIGAPFQVMERRHGTVLRKEIPSRYRRRPDLIERIGWMVVDVLAGLHRVDRNRAGLEDLGRPEGFVERQLEGWTRRWRDAAHEDAPAMDRLIAWLAARRPRSRSVTLLHNDYKLDNLLVETEDPARPVALLDWDMCTSGDPLMDVGYLLNQWAEAGDDPRWIEAAAMPSTAPGFPGRDAAIERYARSSGLDVTGIEWYYAFATMKFAVVIQQIYARYRRGQTRDRRFADYDRRALVYVDKGCRIAGV